MTESFKITVISVIVFCNSLYANTVEAENNSSVIAASVIDSLFTKYGTVGTDNVTVIKTLQFDKLLKSLGLGSVEVICQLNDTACLRNKYIGHNGTRKDPLLSRQRRDVDSSRFLNATAQHAIDWERQLTNCMTSKKIKTLFNINKTGLTKNDFSNICPTLVKQIDDKACVHYHRRFPALEHPEGPPSSAHVWGFGFLAITICSLLSLAVIAMIPCLNKSFYNVLMSYLVALAVGTLAGDAMLHLIPHTFIEGANLAAGIVVSKEQRENQHLSMVWRALFVLVGIYLFFVVEQMMKFKGGCCGKNKGQHGHHNHDTPLTDKVGGSDLVDDNENSSVDQDGHGHSHGGNKVITEKTKITSVAWMVIVGDGFHNFSDGLAVGAAFSASISSGIGTTIAIFCHELPHELGDFAILLKAGMTVRQAIVYNLVSAVLAYVGLALGILAGTGELGRHIILSVTAGLFLYISLVDMMGELTEHDTAVESRVCNMICQHVGLLSGIAIMLVISIYEHDM